MKYLITSILVLVLIIACANIPKKDKNHENVELEVLLVGTSNFHSFNPEMNLDIAQTKQVDVLTEQNQKELEYITDKIAEFNPDKIFVEFPATRQSELDSIFNVFQPIDYQNKKRNELHQLAFRAAKKLNHTKVYANDRRGNFPYNQMIDSAKKAKQNGLLSEMDKEQAEYENKYNEVVEKNQSVTDCLLHVNEEENRKSDLNWYVSMCNQAGTMDYEIGSVLASEWYKRNLYMYANTQKQIETGDKRIMILSGASHVAVFKHFIDLNPKWGVVELRDIL